MMKIVKLSMLFTLLQVSCCETTIKASNPITDSNANYNTDLTDEWSSNDWKLAIENLQCNNSIPATNESDSATARFINLAFQGAKIYKKPKPRINNQDESFREVLKTHQYLDEGFNILRSYGVNISTFNDYMHNELASQNNNAFRLAIVKAQKHIAYQMKDSFLHNLRKIVEDSNSINSVQNPIFIYVMKHKNGFLHHNLTAWIDEIHSEKYSLLHKAVLYDHQEVVEMLLEAQADVNMISGINNNENKSEHNVTPLFIAATRDHLEIMMKLIDAGADLNIKCSTSHKTALIGAIENFNYDAIEHLLQAGADTNIQDINLRTALHESHNDIQSITMLLEHGANPNIGDKWGNTPLFYAVESKNIQIVKILLNVGADINIQNHGGFTVNSLVTNPEIKLLLAEASAQQY